MTRGSRQSVARQGQRSETLQRLLDLLFAVPLLILLSPLLLLLGLAVRLDSAGPALFFQERVGKNGRLFRIIKFRTMFVGADSRGPGITADGDPRVTRVGAFLRRHKLDELPQLFNLLRGEMSLVGPRPELPRYVASYTPRQRQVLAVRPGITGAASLRFHNESELLAAQPDPEQYYRRVLMETKIDEDLAYIAGAGLATDLRMVLRTIGRLLRRN